MEAEELFLIELLLLNRFGDVGEFIVFILLFELFLFPSSVIFRFSIEEFFLFFE